LDATHLWLEVATFISLIWYVNLFIASLDPLIYSSPSLQPCQTSKPTLHALPAWRCYWMVVAWG
jgi:hypothetical protein